MVTVIPSENSNFSPPSISIVPALNSVSLVTFALCPKSPLNLASFAYIIILSESDCIEILVKTP